MEQKENKVKKNLRRDLGLKRPDGEEDRGSRLEINGVAPPDWRCRSRAESEPLAERQERAG
jgi:hypothetical protein